MMVVSPAICGTVITRYGTEEQKQKWLPGICRRHRDDGVRDHRARRRHQLAQDHHDRAPDGDEWLLKGQKIYISGVDEAKTRARRRAYRRRQDRQAQAGLFVVPTDAAGFSYTAIPMEIVSPEQQFQVFIDDVRLPADALVGDEDGGLRAALRRPQPGADHGGRRSPPAWPATRSTRRRRTSRTATVWGRRSARHQGIAHPLAQSKIEIELARLMTQKAAALYEAGDDMGAGEAANMAKYAAAEAACDAADRAVQSHGGNGITQEYGVAGLLVAARAGRIAPVSREMILNFVGMHSLGLPKSY